MAAPNDASDKLFYLLLLKRALKMARVESNDQRKQTVSSCRVLSNI